MARDAEITNTNRLANFAKKVGAAGGPEARKRFNSALKAAVAPAAQAARQSARNIPARGQQSTGLRQAIAKAVSVRATGSGGVRVFVDPKKMPAGQKALPKLLEGPAPFRRRVFGTDVWVSQDAHPWFGPTMAAQSTHVRGDVERVIGEFMRELQRKASS